MPIRYTKKSIFNIEADAVVNTVNCKGVMGKGLALEFKKRFPEMYKEYRRKCEEGEIRIGYIHLYEIRQKRIDSPFKFILNFPTKKDWRHKSKTEYIEEGLKYFRKYVADY
ncbi:MAG: macro domain-containing protein, partial [Candidatus Njordarchaeales archaeon]